MYPFTYKRATDAPSAVSEASKDPGVQFIAGGTSQIDLMKEGVHRPLVVLDVSGLPLGAITALPDGGLRIGALVTNTHAAYHPVIQAHYPAVAEAILAGASAQIRNMASMAGNTLQRTRCPYFRDEAQACNKRQPGSGCSALEGYQRMHAIFGASPACIATQPSDLVVALSAHEARVQVLGPNGKRTIPFDEFHRLPGDTPQYDTTLQQGELITSLDLPPFAGNSHYLKVRDRASYAYALVSSAVALTLDGDTIKAARISLGSVAHKPWRARDAEDFLKGKAPGEAVFRQASALAFKDAKPLPQNAYKIPLGKNTLTRCLMETSGLTPLQGPKATPQASSAGGIAGDMPTV